MGCFACVLGFSTFFFCLLGSPVAATSVGFDVCSAGCSPRWLQALGAPCLSFPCEPGCPHLGSSLGPSQHSGCLGLSVTPLFSAVFQPKSRMSARKSISKCCNKPVASLSFFLMRFFQQILILAEQKPLRDWFVLRLWGRAGCPDVFLAWKLEVLGTLCSLATVWRHGAAQELHGAWALL